MKYKTLGMQSQVLACALAGANVRGTIPVWQGTTERQGLGQPSLISHSWLHAIPVGTAHGLTRHQVMKAKS